MRQLVTEALTKYAPGLENAEVINRSRAPIRVRNLSATAPTRACQIGSARSEHAEVASGRTKTTGGDISLEKNSDTHAHFASLHLTGAGVVRH